MFDGLRDLFSQFWTRMLPVQVVTVGQHAGHIRLGKYHRTLGPGLHWKIPVADAFEIHHTNITTQRFDSQTLTTKDDIQIVLRAIVRYQIDDVEKYIVNCFDQREVLEDTTMGEIQKHVRDHTWAEFDAAALEKEVATAVRRQTGKFGFEIIAVTLTDVGRMRSLRLITTHPPQPGA